LLAGHPELEVTHAVSKSQAGRPVADVLPNLAGQYEGLVFEADGSDVDADVAFLAQPAGEAMQVVPGLLERGIRAIDLGPDYRLPDPAQYARVYKHPHADPDHLAEAVYGLPEFCRSRVPGARLISNPGCYPTAANLAIKPLIDAGIVVRASGIVCDAKSGVSGAGRKPSLKTSFCEVTENFSAYSILDHRHVPEVLRVSRIEESEFSFTAQLLPLDRGILETIYFRATGIGSAEDLLAVYRKAYADEPFLRLYPAKQVPDLRAVTRTNFCDIGVHYDAKTGRAVVISAIDNLVKGAAGQAIQNMNLSLRFAETAGLL